MKLQAELANANAVMEMEFKAELKELETESVTLETKIHEVKGAKGVLLEEIVETERQLLLWEKKIQLKRETISLRFKGKARPSAVEYTQATLRKKVAALRRSIQQTARDAAKYS